MAASIRVWLVVLIVFSGSLFLSVPSRAEVVNWVGAVDSLWNTAANWSANRVPGTLDDVVLDNTRVPFSYKVYLPAGNTAVAVRSLQVVAAASNQIELILPAGNTAAPAFSTAAFPGISLGRGAIFRNASGAASGSAVTTADSLRLLDGGTFIQRSETAHAALITRLAIAPSGREGGIEFDVPGTASYTVSVSNRTYGHLTLSAAAAGGTKNYLSSGSNAVNIRGTLLIGKGVNYNLNSLGAFRVYSHMCIDGSFNVSTGSSSNTVYVGGDLICKGMITESGTGTPVVECFGSRQQHLEISGSWQNAVGLAINNPNGVAVLKPLTLPSKLHLKEGKLMTGADHLITLGASAIIESDALNPDTFIDGPVRKLGLSGQPVYYFPVGKGGQLRWLKLLTPVGDYTVEFFKGDPLSICKVLDTSIDHLSGIEYWSVKSSLDARSSVELSFDNVNSGGVTNLGDLRVAIFRNELWQNAGNTGTSGTAGSFGSVISDAQKLDTVTCLTLASSSNRENPLPVYEVQLRLIPGATGVELTATAKGFVGPIALRLESSTDQKNFHTLVEQTFSGQSSSVILRDTCKSGGVQYYRAVATAPDGQLYHSKIVPHLFLASPVHTFNVFPVPANDLLRIRYTAAYSEGVTIRAIDAQGRCHFVGKLSLVPGNNLIQLSCGLWPPGVYYIQSFNANGRQMTAKVLVAH